MVIRHKAASPPHMDSSRIRQVAPMCTPSNNASFVTPKIGSAVFAQLTAECPILYNGTPLPNTLKIFHSQWGSGPHLTYGSLCPPESSTQTASRSVQPFLRDHYCDRPTGRPRYSVCNNMPHHTYICTLCLEKRIPPNHQQ